ncbi:alanine racemase [Salinimicrobium sp. HB62]|uniref:alanine racemase n=1 Tax=Salinimicrobium sp. HB62 TaxID=3077781 RepID=UPI002D778622|nr:alanine racemase [Salinimicrobium sp. HB62]
MLHITRPKLLLDQQQCRANIQKMQEKAKIQQLQLIPHFKTHQSAQVGEWFRKAGVKAITVTSVKMAKYFAQHGWEDITIAFPVNVLEIDDLNSLANSVNLKIFVNSIRTVALVKDQLKTPVKFYIEVDTGDGRSGVDAGNFSEVSKILGEAKNTSLEFCGFYTHPGHTYTASSIEEVKGISAGVVQNLRNLKDHFKDEYSRIALALGDTPSCSIVEDLEGVNSIHPGNFVYYDLVQTSIGSNTVGEIAICLAVPVVEIHPEKGQVIVHSGWVHQGKDSLVDSDGNTHFGLMVKIEEGKWSSPIPKGKVLKLSQEHGVVNLPKETFEQLKVGDVLGILPVHACATAVMMGEVWTTDGEKIEMMPR